MHRYCPRCGEALHSHSLEAGTTKGEVRKTARRAYEPKKVAREATKRAPSAYNKRYSAEYKRLAKKHPRLKFAALSKRTHKALRRKK